MQIFLNYPSLFISSNDIDWAPVTLTWHCSDADDQGGHYSVQCDGWSKDGHTPSDVVHHLTLRGAAQGKLGEGARLGEIDEEQEER